MAVPTGPVLEALQTGGAIVAFCHSGIIWSLFAGLGPATGRNVHLAYGGPGKRNAKVIDTDRDPLGARLTTMLRVVAEAGRWRFVGPEPRFDVFEQLLREGEVVALAAFPKGSGHAIAKRRRDEARGQRAKLMDSAQVD